MKLGKRIEQFFVMFDFCSDSWDCILVSYTCIYISLSWHYMSPGELETLPMAEKQEPEAWWISTSFAKH